MRDSLRSILLVFVLWLAGLGAAAQFAKIAVPFPLVRALYPQAGSEVGWLLSLVSLLGVVFGMTAGVLVARFGYRRLLVAALFLGGCVSLWQAGLPGFVPMLASRVIEGASHMVIVVAAPTLIAQIVADRYRGAAMTLWSTFFSVSFALMAWFGPPFFLSRGLSGLFAAHGAFMLAVGALIAIWRIPGEPHPATRTAAPLGLVPVLRQHVAAYRSARISAPALGWLFYTLTFVSLLAILPDHLPEESRTRTVTLMPLASIAVSLFIVSPLLSYVPATRIVMAGFAAAGMALSLLWAGLPPSLVWLAVFAALGLVQGASFAAVPELNATAETRALANGAMAQMGNLGNSLGTPVLLAVQSQTGANGLLAAILACYAAGCVTHAVLARRRAALPRP